MPRSRSFSLRRLTRGRNGARTAVPLAAAATAVVVAATVLAVQSGGTDETGDAASAATATRDESRAVGQPATGKGASTEAPVVSVPQDAGTEGGSALAPLPAITPVPPAAASLAAPDAAAAAAPGDPAGTAPRRPGGEPCDVGSAAGRSQVVVVRSSGTRATVRACAQAPDGSYVTELGPFSGYVGKSGVTPATAKREGDGATPGGVFPLQSGFGTKADPGLAQGWRVVDDADVWVDDPASSLYNTPQREPVEGRWASAEKLANPPAYTYAQVIGYNEARWSGAGSAIFLHVATGNPTLGCVSLPTAQLLEVMRWQRPGAVIAIS